MSFEKQLAEQVADIVTSRVLAALEDQFEALANARRTEGLLTLPEAAQRLGIKTATLRQWVHTGRGPVPIKLGAAKQSGLRFHPRAIDQWIAGQERRGQRGC